MAPRARHAGAEWTTPLVGGGGATLPLVTHWTDAGYGTDPEGDARRRAELEHARLDPAAIRAAHERVEDRILAELTGSPPSPLLVPSERLPLVRPVEGETVLADDAHAVTRTTYGSTVAIVCVCGRWECIVSGPSSAAWAGRDHARHVQDEQAGARGE